MSPASKSKRPGLVAVVGAGPGDPGLLTVRGAELLTIADVVICDLAQSDGVLNRCRPDVEVVDVTDLDPATRAKTVVAAAKEGRAVVRLVCGDPAVFGGLAEETEACVRAKVPFEVVPGVSAATAVPAYAGIPVTSTKVRDFVVVDLEAGAKAGWDRLTAVGTIVLLRPTTGTLRRAATALVSAGRPASTPTAVISGGSTVEQHTEVGTLEQLAAGGSTAEVTPAAVVVVGDVVRLRERLSWFETKALFGWRVLLPRTKEQAGSVSTQLRALGAVPVEVPTIAVEPPRSPAPMDRAIKGLVSGRYQWVAFTSTNAVRAVRERLEEVGLDARAFAGVRIAAVGEATARALLDYGVRPDLLPTGEQSSAGLLAEWAPYDDVFDPIDRVLLPRADIATETLVAGLKELGWAVDDVTAYRTVRAAPPAAEIRDALKGGGFDAVLFTSSSTVRNLVGIAGKPHASSVLAAIGPQTRRTAEELGLRIDVVPPAASVPALVDALAAFAVERRLAEMAAGDPAPPTPRRSRPPRAKKSS